MSSFDSRSLRNYASAGRGVGNALGGFMRLRANESAAKKQEEEKLLKSLMEQQRWEREQFNRQLIPNPYFGVEPGSVDPADANFDARNPIQRFSPFSLDTEAGQKAWEGIATKMPLGVPFDAEARRNLKKVEADNEANAATAEEAKNKAEAAKVEREALAERIRKRSDAQIAEDTFIAGMGMKAKKAKAGADIAESTLNKGIDSGITPTQMEMMRQGKVLRGSSMELPGVGGIFPPDMVEGMGDFLTVRKVKTPSTTEAGVDAEGKPSYKKSGEGEQTVVEPLRKVLGSKEASDVLPLPKAKSELIKGKKYQVGGDVMTWDGEKFN